MLRLLLCRHGQSEGDSEPRRIEGSADFSLTPDGESYLDLYHRVAAFSIPPLAKLGWACGDTCIHALRIAPRGPVVLIRLNEQFHLEGLA